MFFESAMVMNFWMRRSAGYDGKLPYRRCPRGGQKTWYCPRFDAQTSDTVRHWNAGTDEWN